MTRFRCPLHPAVVLTCPACLGALGRGVTSPAKRRASRRNAERARKALARKRREAS